MTASLLMLIVVVPTVRMFTSIHNCDEMWESLISFSFTYVHFIYFALKSEVLSTFQQNKKKLNLITVNVFWQHVFPIHRSFVFGEL